MVQDILNWTDSEFGATMGIFNYRTGEYDYIYDLIEDDLIEDYSDYIPQDISTQSLYRLYVGHMSMTPAEATIKVLKASLGIKDE